MSCTGAYYCNASRKSRGGGGAAAAVDAAAVVVVDVDDGTHCSDARRTRSSNNYFGSWPATADPRTHSCYPSTVVAAAAAAAGSSKRRTAGAGTTHTEGSCCSGSGRAAAVSRRDSEYCSTVRLLTMTRCNHNSS